MRIDEVIQQPGQKERMLKEDILRSLHVATPGEVVSYDEKKKTATIQPVIRDWGSTETPPLLMDVPVYFPSKFTFTPQKGDGCLVVFSDSCIDSWVQSGGGVSTPLVYRFHSMSDGFAFVGFNVKNADDINTIIENKKNLQMIVVDPLADGESIEFIDSISQDNNGVIIPTKKTVREATEEEAGLMSAQDKVDLANKVPAPSQDGTNGQVLRTNGDGTTSWTSVGTPTDAQVGEAVSDWLDDHPEATTTVQDGVISRAKLNDDLKNKTDYAEQLQDKAAVSKSTDAHYTVDLDIADIQGNVLVRMENGHIKTKNFDSSDVTSRLSDAEEDIDGIEEDVSRIDGALTDSEEDIDDLETAVAGKQDTLTFDDVPVQNSSNPVKSGGVYNALQGIPRDVNVKDTTKSGVDLDVTDSTGNVIARFSDGHFQTKKFDSRDVEVLVPEAGESDIGKALVVKEVSGGKATAYEFAKTGEDSYVEVKETSKEGVDLDFTDLRGNVLLRLEDGHVQTKEFDSRDVEALVPEAVSSDVGKALIVKEVSGGKATVYEFGETGGASSVDVKDTTKVGVDIDFTDLQGNVLLRLKDGHIQTKRFNSSTFIDDNAGDGDTTKVWSASKTYNEIEPLKRVRTRMEFGAHNGAEYYAPECTIPAYRIAGQQGWQWAWVAGIEFSADGTMYVLHDDTVDRTTDGTGYLNQMTDAQINALHITQTGPGYDLSDFDPSELIIPTFEQVLQQCVFYGMKMVLRLALFPNQYETAAQKEKWDKLVAMLNSYGVQPEDISCYVSTGNQVNVCRTLFGSNVEVSTFLGNAGTAQDYVDWFTSRNITGKKAAIISTENCDLTAAKLLHSYGIRVYTYKYNPTEADAINCASIGVDIFQNGKVYKITS